VALNPKSTPVKWSKTTWVVTIPAALCALPDPRKGGHNQRYAVGDAATGAFSMFSLQSRAFLDFQVRMQKARGRYNTGSLYRIEQIPGMQQIRNLLDPGLAAQCHAAVHVARGANRSRRWIGHAPRTLRAAVGGARRQRTPLFRHDSLPGALDAYVGQ
jgi:hypothetical protein